MNDPLTPPPRRVLVTGGARGIGRAIAAAFVASGDDVVVTGRDLGAARRAAEELGATGAALDLEDVAQVAALAEAFATGIDVLVNNAGAFASPAPPADAPLDAVAEHWRRDLAVNLVGPVLVTSVLEPLLRAGGAVISIGSIGAGYAGNAYSVAKAGLGAWNVGLARRLGPRGVTANVVAPGYVAGTDLFAGPLTPARRDALVGATLVGRPGSPDDVAAVVHALASPAGHHVTGQTLHVDGGAYTTR